MLWFFITLIYLIVFLRGIDVYRHRRPLEEYELIKLAQKRQRNRALKEYDFTRIEIQADSSEKKAMKSQG